MPVLFRERTPEVEGWLAERRASRADRRDEVWEGIYVVAPAAHQRHGRIAARLIARLVPLADGVGLAVADIANVGGPDDYRIPDALVFRPEMSDRPEPYLPTAELVVEIRSPGEDAEAKLPFYRRHGVREVVLIDAATRDVRWLALGDATALSHSAVLDAPVAPIVEGLFESS